MVLYGAVRLSVLLANSPVRLLHSAQLFSFELNRNTTLILY